MEAVVLKTVAETDATTIIDMGKVMTVLMPKVKGRADGTLVSSLIQRHLS